MWNLQREVKDGFGARACSPLHPLPTIRTTLTALLHKSSTTARLWGSRESAAAETPSLIALPISSENSTIHPGAGRAVQHGCSDPAAVPLVPLTKKMSFSCDQDPGTNVPFCKRPPNRAVSDTSLCILFPKQLSWF